MTSCGIRSYLTYASGELAPDGAQHLELELEAQVHLGTKQRAPKPEKLRWSMLLFSCVNSLTFGVLLKEEPVVWGYITLSQLRLIMTTPETVSLSPLKYSLELGRGLPVSPNLGHWAITDNIDTPWGRAVLHFRLTDDKRNMLSVWLDELFTQGAVS